MACRVGGRRTTALAVVALTLTLALFLGVVAGAGAYFTSTGRGTAAVSVGSINPPSNVRLQQTGTTVLISWNAATLSSGGSVQGYRVKRSDGTTICSSPTLVTGLSCTDSAVPPGTSYTYTVTAVYNSFTASATSGSTCPAAPAITEQPASQTVTAPNTATFKAAASTPANCKAPTVQWYVEAPGAHTFSPIAGATSTSYTTLATTTAQNGTKYEAVFTNSFGSKTSSVATLTVNCPPPPTCSAVPSIVEQPENKTVTAPNTATFKAAASTPSNCKAPTVQWYVEAPGAHTFSPIAGATSVSYTTLATTTAQNGTKYEATFTNAFGSKTTAVATLTVNCPPPPCSAAPSITEQPESKTVTVPNTAMFKAAASTPANCKAPTVQWYVEAPGAHSFSPIGGATSASYTTLATTTAQSGTKYEAVFTNSFGSKTSSVAMLTVKVPSPPSINGQASAQA